MLKVLAYFFYALNRRFHPPSPFIQPASIRYYPCRPSLQTRIFYPPNYDSGTLLPLYLSIHGGGFTVGDPEQDDEFYTMWTKRTGMLVVSLNYSKAPLHPFPVAVFDVAALAGAVPADKHLPIEKARAIDRRFQRRRKSCSLRKSTAAPERKHQSRIDFLPDR